MKRKGLFTIFMIGLLTVTGCSEKEKTTVSNENTTQENKVYKEMAVIDQGRLNTASENGYYYVAKDGFMSDEGVYSHNMMYMDFETKKEIVLCNRPGCEHKSESCPSVFSNDIASVGSSLFFLDGKLYLFSHDSDLDGVTTVQKGNSGGLMQEGEHSLSTRPAVLYKMNPDGTNREVVYEFDSNEGVEDEVLVNGKSLLFFTKSLSSESVDNFTSQISATDRKLIEINTENWEKNHVMELETGWKMIGTTDNKIVFTSIDMNEELSKEDYLNDDKYLSAYRNSKTKVMVLDLNDEKVEEILTLPNGKLNSFAVGNNILYYGSEGTEQIKQMNLDSLEESVLKETIANQIDTIYGNVLHCSTWDSVSGDTVDVTMYFINTEDDTETKADLKTKAMGTKVEIKAETEKQFLVVYDLDAKLNTQYDNGQYTINGLKFGLIDKADMYQGNGNYQRIEMIGFGE